MSAPVMCQQCDRNDVPQQPGLPIAVRLPAAHVTKRGEPCAASPGPGTMDPELQELFVWDLPDTPDVAVERKRRAPTGTRRTKAAS